MYAHTQSPVEKTNEEEAPLLASHDGIEFASSDQPSKLLKGRASFKLKISKVVILDIKFSLWNLLFSISVSRYLWKFYAACDSVHEKVIHSL